jgi:multidrug efflux pump subunit AcrA (membrane-fusion protein)
MRPERLPEVLAAAGVARQRWAVRGALLAIAALCACSALLFSQEDADGGSRIGSPPTAAAASIRAPAAAVVETVAVRPGQRVEIGELLLVLRPPAEESP